MSPRAAWLSFERHGGLPPRDDESLKLAADGSFTAHRTVAGSIVGSFAGVLSASTMGKLRKAVAAAADADSLVIETPAHGATERVAIAGRTLELGSNAAAPKPWRAVSSQLRAVLQGEVVAQPLAAIRLVVDAARARLEHAGTAPIEIDRGSLEVRVVLMGADEVPRERWAHGRDADPGADAAWVTARPGWSMDLPFDHGFRPAAGEWLQVRVELTIRNEGRRYAARLYAPVITDG